MKIGVMSKVGERSKSQFGMMEHKGHNKKEKTPYTSIYCFMFDGPHKVRDCPKENEFQSYGGKDGRVCARRMRIWDRYESSTPLRQGRSLHDGANGEREEELDLLVVPMDDYKLVLGLELCYKVNRDAIKWRTKPISKYDELSKLFAKDRAWGVASQTAKEKKWQSRKKLPIDIKTSEDINELLATNKVTYENLMNLEKIHVDSPMSFSPKDASNANKIQK
ncbi:hypothetical protein Tco_0435346 [Tanacetum coccineum]